jgi:formiminotetrahydrofolate cyclodeaminase
MAALKLPKERLEQAAIRDQAIQQAALAAAQVPLEIARQAMEILSLSAKIAAFGNLNAISDSASETALARAALTSAGWNVRINCLPLKEQPACQEMLAELRLLEARALELETQVHQQMQVRGQLPL